MIAQTHTRTQVDVQKKEKYRRKRHRQHRWRYAKGFYTTFFFFCSRPTNKSRKREKKKA